jgi:hypothetical protein
MPDPDPDFLTISDPGSRGQKGTGSWIRIRNTVYNKTQGQVGLWSGLCVNASLDFEHGSGA